MNLALCRQEMKLERQPGQIVIASSFIASPIYRPPPSPGSEALSPLVSLLTLSPSLSTSFSHFFSRSIRRNAENSLHWVKYFRRAIGFDGVHISKANRLKRYILRAKMLKMENTY